MIQIEKTEVVGWEHAIRGMRNPMNSWAKSDSLFEIMEIEEAETGDLFDTAISKIGAADHELMMQLRNADTDHRKFMRMIDVYADITAPRYWWTEFDTYKVGTVANSCSTMHKIHAKEFTMDDFSHEHLDRFGLELLEQIISCLNIAREDYNKNDKSRLEAMGVDRKYDWWQMIQLLPQSYNQRRTVKLNYEVLANIYNSRKAHKLDEWRELCKWIESLPYAELITGKEDE